MIEKKNLNKNKKKQRKQRNVIESLQKHEKEYKEGNVLFNEPCLKYAVRHLV